MKLRNKLIPIVALATATTVATPLTSCNNSKTWNIEFNGEYKNDVSVLSQSIVSKNLNITLKSLSENKIIDKIEQIKINDYQLTNDDFEFIKSDSKLIIKENIINSHNGIIYITPHLTYKEATAINLSKHNINLNINEITTIYANLKFTNANEIIWTTNPESSDIIKLNKTTSVSGEVITIRALKSGTVELIAKADNVSDRCNISINTTPSPEITELTSANFKGVTEIDNIVEPNELFSPNNLTVKGKINSGELQNLVIGSHYLVYDSNDNNITATILANQYSFSSTEGKYNFTIKPISGSASPLVLTITVLPPTELRTITLDFSSVEKDFVLDIPSIVTSLNPTVYFSTSTLSQIQSRIGTFIFTYTQPGNAPIIVPTSLLSLSRTLTENIKVMFNNIFYDMRINKITEAEVKVEFVDELCLASPTGLLTLTDVGKASETVTIPEYAYNLISEQPIKVIGIAENGCSNSNVKTLTWAKPENIKKILSSAFKNCASLTQIEIPTSVFRINNNAFEGCDSLTNVTFINQTRTWKQTNTDSNIVISDPAKNATNLRNCDSASSDNWGSTGVDCTSFTITTEKPSQSTYGFNYDSTTGEYYNEAGANRYRNYAIKLNLKTVGEMKLTINWDINPTDSEYYDFYICNLNGDYYSYPYKVSIDGDTHKQGACVFTNIPEGDNFIIIRCYCYNPAEHQCSFTLEHEF